MTRADIVEMHTITPAEVKKWFECHRKPRPSDAVYVEIAGKLSKMRWGGDPPKQPLPDDAREWWWRARTWLPTDPPLQKPDSVGAKECWYFEQPKGPGGISGIKYAVQADGSWLRQDIIWDPTLDLEADAVEWWDLKDVAAAADKLRGAIPLMLSYWGRVRRKREKCERVAKMGDRYDAIKALDDALTAAMPCFSPFGECEPSHRKQPKAWHMPAILIAHWISEALIKSGRPPRSFRQILPPSKSRTRHCAR
jgi:hypothetical protein